MTDLAVVEAYLAAVRDVHSSGAASPETSYYPAISNLLSAIGNTLKPKVKCVMNLKQGGNGMPDGGLFIAHQLSRQTGLEAVQSGQLPLRGAIEAKGTVAKLDVLARSAQVQGYLEVYGIVLITNLRQFAIVDKHGIREQYTLAATQDAFWQTVAATPHASAAAQGTFFAEFLRRACLHDAPLTTPKDVAWFLASYARDALARVEAKKDLAALQNVRTALEQALGMTFTGADGEHFFRSTLVQTLFYGVFSAWVKWCEDAPAITQSFDWRSAAWTLHVPFIRSLYQMIAQPNTLGPLGLVEPIDWAAGALNRVDRSVFFSRFERTHAVQYFYEPFLEAYDPQLRKDLGVWYTPPEVVKYQVARVDRVLREELNLPDGLANPDVVVLDPCCGTGAYLVEVLNTIAATLKANGGDALSASDLKTAATTRVFGFEIMPAPFVVAHLQLGLLLQNEGAPLDLERNERVGVYLTNALTGWEPPAVGQQQVLGNWLDLREEKDAAEAVKRGQPILVIIGNPPYNAFAGTSPTEEQGLVEPYKQGLNTPVAQGGWGIKKFNLDDLYVRFFRLAERRIAEMSGRGVVSFISNFSYLSDPSFVVMRQRFLAEFDKLWLDCMNGDSRETGKQTPDGLPDPSVFSTDFNREGIRVGTAICTVVRKPERQETPTVRFRNFWGAGKRADLAASLQADDFDAAYLTANPTHDNRLSFRPEDIDSDYATWPRLTEIAAQMPLQGMDEDRANAFIEIRSDSKKLARRMEHYFDATVPMPSEADVRGLARRSAGFDPATMRSRAIEAESFARDRIKPYLFRPFDRRECYSTDVPNLWKRHRPELKAAAQIKNTFVLSRTAGVAAPEGVPIYYATGLLARDSMKGHAIAFPRTLSDTVEQGIFATVCRANLSAVSRTYLTSLHLNEPDTDANTASLIWMHALAIGYAPAYLSENADGIRRDWPRIPLPATRAALEASAALGERVAALLDTEADVAGVTSGTLTALLKTVGGIAKTDGGKINPNGDDLALTVNWGYAGQANATMPGRGRTVTRPFTDAEQQALHAGAAATGQTPDVLTAVLGGETRDVYLNDTVFWRNVPAAAWEFYIGGYQVMKKWLSYRERDLLGRPLKVEEAREVTAMVRRLTALVLLRPQLDANYTAVAADTYAWPAA